MLDVKRYQDLLADAQRRASQLEKKNAPLVRAADDARATNDDLQRQVAALQKRLNDFENSAADMTDDEYMTARARVDLLRVRQKRAAEVAAAAAAALRDAQEVARSEIKELRNVALNDWTMARLNADEEYRKAWGRLA